MSDETMTSGASGTVTTGDRRPSWADMLEMATALWVAKDALLRATDGDEYSEFVDELAAIDAAYAKAMGGTITSGKPSEQSEAVVP